ncbi:MAG TPA: glycosyltransferase family 4 protein [Actinomycetales bacterium]|nr:glycosyltransferase family 4 protein [Actinomycetales bacterium]
MRIAYVCADPGVPVFGQKGASVHVQEVLRVLVARGHDVTLYCTRLGGTAPAGVRSVRVRSLVPAGADDLAGREASARRAAVALQRRVVEEGPWDLVYERYSLWSRAAADRADVEPLLVGTPSVLEVNAPLVQEQALHRGLVDRAGAEAVARDALASATAVTAVSEPVARWARSAGAAAGAVHVLPNGVDTDRIRPGARPARPFTVGFVGTLKPWHGTSVLVDAFAGLAVSDPTARLRLVGHGPQAEALAAQSRDLGLAHRVELVGAVAPEVVPAALQEFDVAVAPYDDPEQDYFSPLKVFEYLAAGLPVVASDVGQLRELLDVDGEPAGLLVPPGDPAALRQALCALAQDTALRHRLGNRARRLAVQRHRWEHVVDRAVGLALAGPALEVAG